MPDPNRVECSALKLAGSRAAASKGVERMLRRDCSLLFFVLLLLGEVYGDASKNRARRQSPPSQNGQVIDNIFNIPIAAIRQTAAAAQVISPDNTQTIDSIFKIPVLTLEAVGDLVKSTAERRQQNAENIRERRERLQALKEQQRKRREEIHRQRLMQHQQKRIVRNHHKDPIGLNAFSDLLVGHHGILGHHPGLGGAHGHHGGHTLHGLHGNVHGGHGILGSHGGHGTSGNRPQNNYEVYEDPNEVTSGFSWHGLTAGFGSFFGNRPADTAVKIENKIAPKEKRRKIAGYLNDDVNAENKLAKIGDRPRGEYDEPPLENKIAPRNGRVVFAQ